MAKGFYWGIKNVECRMYALLAPLAGNVGLNSYGIFKFKFLKDLLAEILFPSLQLFYLHKAKPTVKNSGLTNLNLKMGFEKTIFSRIPQEFLPPFFILNS